jgi:hypothetical protein
MTEAELIGASANYNGLMQGWVSLYFTALTAFIIAAYLAGSKLTRNQTVFIYGGFLILSALATVGAYGTGNLLVHYADEVLLVNPKRPFLASYPIIYASTALLSIGIMGSLKFMWDIRHPKPE